MAVPKRALKCTLQALGRSLGEAGRAAELGGRCPPSRPSFWGRFSLSSREAELQRAPFRLKCGALMAPPNSPNSVRKLTRPPGAGRGLQLLECEQKDRESRSLSQTPSTSRL